MAKPLMIDFTMDMTTTPVTPRLTHDTGPLFWVGSSFLDLIPMLSGRGNFEPGFEPPAPPPLANLTGPEVGRPEMKELILGNFERQRSIVPGFIGFLLKRTQGESLLIIFPIGFKF